MKKTILIILAVLLIYAAFSYAQYSGHQKKLKQCTSFKNIEKMSPDPVSLCIYNNNQTFWEIFFRKNKPKMI